MSAGCTGSGGSKLILGFQDPGPFETLSKVLGLSLVQFFFLWFLVDGFGLANLFEEPGEATPDLSGGGAFKERLKGCLPKKKNGLLLGVKRAPACAKLGPGHFMNGLVTSQRSLDLWVSTDVIMPRPSAGKVAAPCIFSIHPSLSMIKKPNGRKLESVFVVLSLDRALGLFKFNHVYFLEVRCVGARLVMGSSASASVAALKRPGQTEAT